MAETAAAPRGNGVVGRSVHLAEVKVVHFIRHGEAEHNVAARLHGRQEYRKWDFLDAPLTDKGRDQASAARGVLLPHMKPQVVLVSPLTRTLQTAEEIFQPLTDEERKAQPKFEVWESIRERIGQNPCDKRRKVSEIKPKFPLFSFDRMESDEDHLWGDMRESTEELLHRARTFLHALRQRPETCIGVVSHSAFLTALFVVLTTEEGLRNNGACGAPDVIAASSPDAVVSPVTAPHAGGGDHHIDGDLDVKTKQEKVYFTNGEVKSVVLLPSHAFSTGDVMTYAHNTVNITNAKAPNKTDFWLQAGYERTAAFERDYYVTAAPL